MTSTPSLPCQRAFAGKRSKMTAADVRKHVMTGSVLLHPTSFDAADGNTGNIYLLDVVDPVDVEEVLVQRKTSAFYDISSSCSSPRKVSEFPSDDVEVRINPRETHTVDPLPYDTAEITIEPHVRDILQSFTDQLALVQRKYQQFGSADAYVRMLIERPIIVKNTTRPLFEMDGIRGERVARSASLVADSQDIIPKRHSYASTISTGTMGSNEGDVREQHLSHSQSDMTISGIIQRISLLQLDQTNDTKRLSGRHSNLINLLPIQQESDVVEKRTAPLYPDEVFAQKLIIKVLKLELQPFFEPIFGSMAIYDAKQRRKVTETFHFDVNPERLTKMLNMNSGPLGKCNQAAFNLSGSLGDLFLVIRLTKILQACEVVDACDPYVTQKDEKGKEKLFTNAAENASRLGSYRMPLGFMVVDVQKLLTAPNPSSILSRADSMVASQVSAVSQSTTIGSTCGDMTMSSVEDVHSIVSADRVSLSSTSTFRRIGSGTSAATVLNRVRTPLQKRKFLGSTGDDNSSISKEPESTAPAAPELSLSSMKPVTLNINSFFRQEGDKLSEEDLFKLLAEARKPGGRLSKLKTFPASLSLQISGGTGEELILRLNSDFQKMAPFTPLPEADLTKDIQEFPAKGQYSVNTTYKNLLYVYPKSVNFSGRQGTARNICVKVEMMNAKEVAQQVIFPNDSGTTLKYHTFSSIIYHSRIPQLCDEFKMRLPLELDDGFHLLFTFYHISCKNGGKDDETTYPIGYSWLPLYRSGHLESGDYSLPICLEKPPQSYGYLSPEGALPNIKWLEGHKPLFNVSLKAISTVHPQDDYLENFFVAVSSLASNDRRKPPINEAGLISAIQGILKARPEPMVSFMYNVLDKLIALVARPPYSEAVSAVCFETLGQIVKICTLLLDSCLDTHGRSSLLTSYIHYFKIALKESKDQSVLCKEIGREKQKPGSPETQKLFNIIEDVERSSTRKPSVETVPLTPNKTVHEQIAELWVKSVAQAREMAFTNSWFFLELMMKSMAEYLSMTGRLYLVRRSRFSERFIKDLDALSAAISVEIITRMTKDARQSQSLTNSWAFFLRDAFSLMDRSYVMSLVRDFNQTISLKISCSNEPTISTLMLLKLDFMRIVCSHEHFVILNIPFSYSSMSISTSSVCIPPPSQLQPPSPGAASLSSRYGSDASREHLHRSTGTVDSSGSLGSGELTTDYRRAHFLLGLVLADLSSILESTNNTVLHSRAIGIIRNLMATHEADSRLSDSTVKSRVAALYLPLVTIVLDNASRIYDPYAANGNGTNDRRFILGDRYQSAPGMNPKVALAIAGIGTNSPPLSPTGEQKQKPMKPKLSLELSRQLLACFCWVLKHMDPSLLKHWVREFPPNKLSQMLDVLQLCVSCFEYKQTKEEQPVDSESQDSSGSSNFVKWRKDTMQNDDDEIILDGALSTEITLCVLDMLETIVRVICMPGSDHLLFALPIVLREMMHMLACNQSVQALDSIFASQRALIVKYPELVFEQETEQCGELCLQLLRHCASTVPSIRSQSSASIYLLMRESYETGNSLARVKMQITMSLSTLVSHGTRSGMWLNEDCLRRSFKTILNYAETDAHADLQRSNTCFTEQVKDLVFNLHMILSDTVKMKEYANDYEMTLDLMFRIAKGYQNNPDLRLTWLLNMASRHAEKGLNCEASQCMLHASALAAEYIAMTTTDGNMPPGAAAFKKVSENVHEESAVSDDVVSPETDGICESRHFTAVGLVQLIEKTATMLEKAQMYELLPELFKVIEPVLTEWRDFRRLSAIHARISEALSKIEPTVSIVEDTSDAWLSPLSTTDKRCFGTYFRVGFYGSRFVDLDGEEFIYKEPPFTKLSEISHRLEQFYTDRFGKGIVEVIKDSNNVVRTMHHSDKAYLQITYVEPFLEKWEKRRRPTHFERSHRLKRFVYATPFTKDGKAHGDLKDQYKRRTILTTQNSFPYVKTRIRVIEKEQKVLQPIQVAIEDIEKKTRELSAAIAQVPPDAKMLQMVLQGCIGTTVNQGPVEIANVFLADVMLDDRGKPVDKLQNKLRLAFRDFSKKCADALSLNKQLIQADQLAYQNELQKNYVEFTRKMAPIMGGRKHSAQQKSGLPSELDLAGPITAV